MKCWHQYFLGEFFFWFWFSCLIAVRLLYTPFVTVGVGVVFSVNFLLCLLFLVGSCPNFMKVLTLILYVLSSHDGEWDEQRLKDTIFITLSWRRLVYPRRYPPPPPPPSSPPLKGDATVEVNRSLSWEGCYADYNFGENKKWEQNVICI